VSTCQHAPSRKRVSPCHRASMPPRASACPLVNVSTCQHAPSCKRVSPCHRASMPPRFTFARTHRPLVPVSPCPRVP